MEMSLWTWYVGLLAGGLMLVIAEVFIPGGIVGLFGVAALLGAMGVGLATFPPPWNFISALGIIVFGGIFLLLWIQFFPRTRTGRRIALRQDGADYKSAAAPAPALRGQTGEAITALRPAGIVLVDGKRYDVLADGGEWIAAGAAIRVSDIRDGHLIVSDTTSA